MHRRFVLLLAPGFHHTLFRRFCLVSVVDIIIYALFLRYPCYTIHELYDMLMFYDDGFATHFHDFVDDANNDILSPALVLCLSKVL